MKQKQKDLPGKKKDLPGNKKERFTRTQKRKIHQETKNKDLPGNKKKDLLGNKKGRFTRKQKRKIYQETKKIYQETKTKNLPGNKKERFTRKQNPPPFLHHQNTTSIKMKKTFLEYGTKSGPKKLTNFH